MPELRLTDPETAWSAAETEARHRQRLMPWKGCVSDPDYMIRVATDLQLC